MRRSRIAQEVSGSGNQTSAYTGTQQQIHNNQRYTLEIHLSAPVRPPLFSFQHMCIHVSLDTGSAIADG